MSETNDSGDGDGSGDGEDYTYDWKAEHLRMQQLKAANAQIGTPVQAWLVEWQAASAVTKGGNTFFKNLIDECVTGIRTFVTDNKAMKSGGGFGSQDTIHDFGDTVTLDFQGLRTNGSHDWFDFQGQVGGGGSKRRTYFQVMVLKDAGDAPTEDHIRTAIARSLKDGGRSIIVLDAVRDRPK